MSVDASMDGIEVNRVVKNQIETRVMDIKALPNIRRHTYFFLKQAKNNCPVYLDMPVDMSRIVQLRNEAKREGRSFSYITYIIKAIATVMEHHPQANTSVRSWLMPKVAYYKPINAKFTMDKAVNGERIVTSAVISNANKEPLGGIQQVLNNYKVSDFNDIEEFDGIRKLHQLPFWIGKLASSIMLSNFRHRINIQGSFTVTSLGHHPVGSFFPMSANTTTFGVGAVTDTPVCENKEVVVKPMLKLCMVFDHRVIDGAMAADFMLDIKESLENFLDNK